MFCSSGLHFCQPHLCYVSSQPTEPCPLPLFSSSGCRLQAQHVHVPPVSFVTHSVACSRATKTCPLFAPHLCVFVLLPHLTLWTSVPSPVCLCFAATLNLVDLCTFTCVSLLCCRSKPCGPLYLHLCVFVLLPHLTSWTSVPSPVCLCFAAAVNLVDLVSGLLIIAILVVFAIPGSYSMVLGIGAVEVLVLFVVRYSGVHEF